MPLQQFTGLYRTFAELAPTKQDIANFADAFGYLGSRLIKNPPDGADEQLDNVRQVVGEGLEDWKAHILVMKDAVEVWDLVTARDTRTLARLERGKRLFTVVPKHRKKEYAAVDPPRPRGTLVGSFQIDSDHRSGHAGRLIGLDKGLTSRILEQAKDFVTTEVNLHLSEHGVTPRLQSDFTEGEPRFCVTPRTLLGAMWLQFADAVGQQKQFRRCRECHTAFEILAGRAGARSDSQFCKPACKSAFHNAKRRKVRELRDQKHSLRKIAKQFDTDIPTVKKWLGETSQPRKRTRRS